MGRLILGFLLPMHFNTRLVQLRKERDLTQQALADLVGLHVNQIKKYEAGTAQPTLKALIKLAKNLHVSLDDLVFGVDERGPDDELRLQFEAISQMSDEEKHVIKSMLDGMIIKHQTKQMVNTIST